MLQKKLWITLGQPNMLVGSTIRIMFRKYVYLTYIINIDTLLIVNVHLYSNL